MARDSLLAFFPLSTRNDQRVFPLSYGFAFLKPEYEDIRFTPRPVPPSTPQY